MTAEIYITILQGNDRLVITGDMNLFQNLMTTIQSTKQISNATTYNPAPEQESNLRSI